MRIEQDSLGKAKHGLHAAQALFIFIAACLALAILTKSGYTGGHVGFFFGLAFLSIPALIYQVMVPAWPRARRFANVYAYAVVDILFAILWFSAYIAVAAWLRAGILAGEKSEDKDKKGDGDCAKFDYGDSTKCSVTKAAIGFGVMIFLMFVGTAVISVLFVRRYRQDGVMPGRREKSTGLITDDAAKDVWSTNIEERDHDDTSDGHETLDERRKYGQVAQDDEHELLHATTSHDTLNDGHPHPGRAMSYSSSNQSIQTAQQYDSYVPSALSPGGYELDRTPIYQPPPPQFTGGQNGRVNFPNGNYDRV